MRSQVCDEQKVVSVWEPPSNKRPKRNPTVAWRLLAVPAAEQEQQMALNAYPALQRLPSVGCRNIGWPAGSPLELRHREVAAGVDISGDAGGDHVPQAVHRHGKCNIANGTERVEGALDALLP